MSTTTSAFENAQTTFSSLGGKLGDTVSAMAEANQRVVGELVELTSAAARERVRTALEMQSSLLEAVRSIPAPSMPSRSTIDELRQDPFAWYRKGLMAYLDGTQRTLKLFETQAQIVTRSVERFHATAEKSSRVIEDAMSGYQSKMQDLYGRS